MCLFYFQRKTFQADAISRCCLPGDCQVGCADDDRGLYIYCSRNFKNNNSRYAIHNRFPKASGSAIIQGCYFQNDATSASLCIPAPSLGARKGGYLAIKSGNDIG